MSSIETRHRIHVVGTHTELIGAIRCLDSRALVDWVFHDSTETFCRLDPHRDPEHPVRVVLVGREAKEFTSTQLRQLHEAHDVLRLAVCVEHLEAGDERRLIFAGACDVYRLPLSPLSLERFFDDRAYLGAVFPGTMIAARSESHEIVLPTVQEAAPPLTRFICERLDAFGAPSELVRSVLPLVLDEVVINAMTHGNQWDISKAVTVSLKIDSTRLWLRVVDEGNGFDRSTVADPRSDDRRSVEGGRGLFLMERLMDDVCYEKGGRSIVLTKFLGAKQPA